MPPRSAVINGQDETPLLLLSPPTSTCSKTMPPGGRTTPKAPSSSDPVDPDLRFPPKLPDQVDVTCNDDASSRERRPSRRHRPPRLQSCAIFTGSHVFPTSRLAGTERNLATKTYVTLGSPAEIRHLLTGPSTRLRSGEGLPAAVSIGALDPQSPPSPSRPEQPTPPDGELPPPPSIQGRRFAGYGASATAARLGVAAPSAAFGSHERSRLR